MLDPESSLSFDSGVPFRGAIQHGGSLKKKNNDLIIPSGEKQKNPLYFKIEMFLKLKI